MMTTLYHLIEQAEDARAQLVAAVGKELAAGRVTKARAYDILVVEAGCDPAQAHLDVEEIAEKSRGDAYLSPNQRGRLAYLCWFHAYQSSWDDEDTLAAAASLYRVACAGKLFPSQYPQSWEGEPTNPKFLVEHHIERVINGVSMACEDAERDAFIAALLAGRVIDQDLLDQRVLACL